MISGDSPTDDEATPKTNVTLEIEKDLSGDTLEAGIQKGKGVYIVSNDVPSESHTKGTDKNEKGSPLLLSVMNISNNIVGSGIITLSLAIKDSGVGLGLILLFVSNLACGWTLMIAGMCSEITKTDTYEKMTLKLLGRNASRFLIVCTILFPITGAMAYSIAIADNLTLFFGGMVPDATVLQTRAVVLLIPWFCVILPLSLLRNLQFLDKFSSFSMCLVLLYVCTIIYKASTIPLEIITPSSTWSFGRSNAIKALPVFAFACSCHHNAVSFYRSLKNPSINKFSNSKGIAIFLSTILYVTVSICGYVSFGGNPFGNVFINYCSDDVLMSAIRIIFSITLMLTAPLQVFGPREVLIREVLFKWSKYKFVSPIVTFLIVVFCYIIGSTVTSLSIVVEIGSALSNVPIVYILPAICAIRVYKKPYYPNDLKKSVAWFVLLFGLLMLIAGPIFTIIDAVKTGGVVPTAKYYCNLPIYNDT